MEVKHAQIDNRIATVQILRMACPQCKEAVQFVICEDDRLHKEDAEYYEKRCGEAADEIKRLRKIIDSLVCKMAKL